MPNTKFEASEAKAKDERKGLARTWVGDTRNTVYLIALKDGEHLATGMCGYLRHSVVCRAYSSSDELPCSVG